MGKLGDAHAQERRGGVAGQVRRGIDDEDAADAEAEAGAAVFAGVGLVVGMLLWRRRRSGVLRRAACVGLLLRPGLIEQAIGRPSQGRRDDEGDHEQEAQGTLADGMEGDGLHSSLHSISDKYIPYSSRCRVNSMLFSSRHPNPGLSSRYACQNRDFTLPDDARSLQCPPLERSESGFRFIEPFAFLNVFILPVGPAINSRADKSL